MVATAGNMTIAPAPICRINWRRLGAGEETAPGSGEKKAVAAKLSDGEPNGFGSDRACQA